MTIQLKFKGQCDVSGIKVLLDTNVVIGLVKGNDSLLNLLQKFQLAISDCSYSFITRIELLSFPNITETEIQEITAVLVAMQYLPMTQAIENTTIQLRRRYNLKTPDAIIAATAKVHKLELLTLDQQLANRMNEIVNMDKE